MDNANTMLTQSANTAGTGTADLGAYFANMWASFVNYIPQLIGAAVVLIIGFILAYAIGAVVRRLIRFTGIDSWVERAGLNRRLSLANTSSYALVSNMLASIVRWV